MKRIPLTQGQFALVDDQDFSDLARFNWCAHWNESTQSYYAERNERRETGGYRTLKMHRYILGVNDPKVRTDHRNHDTLDNRRQNLRAVTSRVNARNLRGARRDSQTKVRGVSLRKGKFIARIYDANGRRLWLGVYSTLKEAAAVFAAAKKIHYGENHGKTRLAQPVVSRKVVRLPRQYTVDRNAP